MKDTAITNLELDVQHLEWTQQLHGKGEVLPGYQSERAVCDSWVKFWKRRSVEQRRNERGVSNAGEVSRS